MKKVLICAGAFTLLATVANAQKTKAKPAAKTTVPAKSIMRNMNDSFSYAAGLNIASSMKEQGITQLNAALVQRAIQDVFENRKLLLTSEQANMTLQQQLQAFQQKKLDLEKARCASFMDINKTRKGVIALPNGIQYEILKAGEPNGLKPTAADTVVVHYAGTLIDGTEFDNSIKRNEPATFPVGGVISGWTQILQLMPVGSKWKVYIPSEFGYGDRGAGAGIPPGATLIFEINLLDIKPAVKG